MDSGLEKGESKPLASLMWERDMWGNASWTVDWMRDEQEDIWFWTPNKMCVDDMMEWSNMPQELV